MKTNFELNALLRSHYNFPTNLQLRVSWLCRNSWTTDVRPRPWPSLRQSVRTVITKCPTVPLIEATITTLQRRASAEYYLNACREQQKKEAPVTKYAQRMLGKGDSSSVNDTVDVMRHSENCTGKILLRLTCYNRCLQNRKRNWICPS